MGEGLRDLLRDCEGERETGEEDTERVPKGSLGGVERANDGEC